VIPFGMCKERISDHKQYMASQKHAGLYCKSPSYNVVHSLYSPSGSTLSIGYQL
jgi:hypothetical protein